MRYPSKLKQVEEELIDTKLKLSTVEKKYAIAENLAKEMEDNTKRVKAMVTEEQNLEATRIQQHYNKLVDRLEEDNRSLKDRIRVYEVKVNDL